MLVLKCKCGKEGRYSRFNEGAIETSHCSKRGDCLSYEEQRHKITQLESDNRRMKSQLEKIVAVSAMDYEYRTWAKEGLQDIVSGI